MRSLKNNRLYTGSAEDAQKRFVDHNHGRSKYTRATRPFVLLHTEVFPTRGEAVRREKFLKTGKGRHELKMLLENKDNK